MKFQVAIRGDFNNVAGLAVAQNYYISVQCGACRAVHKKAIFISDEMVKKVKVKEVVGKVETYNLTVECRDCGNLMCIKMNEPDDKISVRMNENNEAYDEEDPEMKVFPVVGDKCHISTIQSDSAVVTDVDGLILDVVDKHGMLFSNCRFDKHILAEDNTRGCIIDIQNLSLVVEQQ